MHLPCSSLSRLECVTLKVCSAVKEFRARNRSAAQLADLISSVQTTLLVDEYTYGRYPRDFGMPRDVQGIVREAIDAASHRRRRGAVRSNEFAGAACATAFGAVELHVVS